MMMRIVNFSILLTFFLGSMCPSHAGQKARLNAAEVLEKVQEAYSNIKDASAEFTQTVSLKYAKIEQTFIGSVMMKVGNKYRIESQEQTLVTDGTTVWVYSPVNKQVLIDSYKENPNTFSLEQFLVGVPENFRAALVDEDTTGTDAAYIMKLSPKSGAAKSVKSLKVWIDDTDWNIRRVEYIDMDETRSVYTLKDVRFNTGIPDERFVFAVPGHVKVIDLRTAEHNAPHQ